MPGCCRGAVTSARGVRNIKIETDFRPQQSEALLFHVHLSMNKQRFILLRFEFGSGSVRVHTNACCLLASARSCQGERYWHSVDTLSCGLCLGQQSSWTLPLTQSAADSLLGGGGELAKDSTLSRGKTAPVILIAHLFLYVSLLFCYCCLLLLLEPLCLHLFFACWWLCQNRSSLREAKL